MNDKEIEQISRQVEQEYFRQFGAPPSITSTLYEEYRRRYHKWLHERMGWEPVEQCRVDCENVPTFLR